MTAEQQIRQLTEERDRARSIAVALEQENAVLTAEVNAGKHEYQQTDFVLTDAVRVAWSLMVTPAEMELFVVGERGPWCPCGHLPAADRHRTAEYVLAEAEEPDP